jgi:effector-binding domain-containing protein
MPPLQVRLESQSGTPLAVVRRRVPASELSRVVPECCGHVWQVMRAQNAKAGRNVALYWDDAIRLEAGVEALGPFVERDDVVRSATPGGLVVAVTFFGPYSGLGAAHAAIRDWAKGDSQRLEGPNWEIYGHWQDTWNTDPSLIRTDVCYQVAGP